MKTLILFYVVINLFGEDLYFRVPLKNEATCRDALTVVLPVFQQDWPDAIGMCKQTEIMLGGAPPRRRP